MSVVVGIDLALRATGVAYADGTVGTITPRVVGMERIEVIRAAVAEALSPPPDLVAIEGYSFGSGSALASLAEAGGVVRWLIWSAGIDAVEVAPKTLKKYATGRGGANKTAVVIAARDRLGYRGDDADEADALWLRAIGLALLGEAPVPLPKTHLTALSAVKTRTGRRR